MKRTLLVTFGVGFISAGLLKKKNNEIKQLKKQLQKLSWYYQMLNMWLEMKQKGKSAVTYLQKEGINSIAIYGMKELGERFYEEVKNTEIEVPCVIDQNADFILGNFKVISPDQTIPEVDAIIVTADYYFWEIKTQLEKRVCCPIYSLNGILGNSFGRNL